MNTLFLTKIWVQEFPKKISEKDIGTQMKQKEDAQTLDITRRCNGARAYIAQMLQVIKCASKSKYILF
jgi:hypothetical protein